MKKIGKKMIMLTMAILFFSCESNEVVNQLPPITETGANTFGCVINGEVLIPKDSNGIPRANGLKAYYKDNETFIIDIDNYDDSNANGSLYLYLHDLSSEGIYGLGLSEGLTSFYFEPNYSHLWCRVYDDSTGNKKYISTDESGTVEIVKFDTSNNIISGFIDNIILVNINNPYDKIEITNGRFDINLNTVNS